ncbi:MAG: endolytic transglycosylase MltG [Alphaproteobacteria bacterium]
MENRATRFLIAVFVVLFVAVAAVGLVGRELARPGPLAAERTVVIPNGTSTKAMAALLAREGVLHSARMFELAARVSGFAPTLKAGEYVFEAGVSPRQVLSKLAFGHTASRSMTLPEGLTVKQVLAMVEGDKTLSGAARPIPEEGRMFPDTYTFTHGTPRAKLLEQMTVRMDQELADAWAARDGNIPLASAEELLILASIVQKEAANDAEMPLVAGVFANRLRKGMLLQSDPTVMYGADMVGNDITSKELKEANPFNTYQNKGLPPTPIANPGRAALQAAARPASTEALFFMAKPDRSGHVFTTTYAEHQKAVKAYWSAYNQRKQESVKP